MMAALLQKELGNEFQMESAGWFRNQVGEPASENAVFFMRVRGIDISEHKARWIRDLDLKAFSHIVCVNPDMAYNIRSNLENDQTMVLIAGVEVGGVPDPYGKGRDAYRECANLLDKAMHEIAAIIRNS
jgi:protein-tyrosine-phosphatase